MRECSLDTLIQHHPQGVTVLDVREPEEYVEGHVPGALLIPMGQVPDRMDEVPREGPVYVICASGRRSQTSAAQLEEAGFDAYSVAGGTSGWIERGQEVVTGSSPR